jgi:glucose-1-phosphate thymidylyltransferase
LGNGARFGAQLTYVEQDAPRGLAHAVQTGRTFLGDGPFVVFLGDNVLRGGIADAVRSFEDSSSEARLLLKPVANPSDFGIAELHEDGRVRRLTEKPPQPPTNLAVLGVYMLRRRFFEAADKIRPSARGELEITDALQAMIDNGLHVHASVIEEDWLDTGSPRDLLAANRMLLCDHRSHEGYTVLEGTRLDAPVQIGESAVLYETRVTGPAIIGPRTAVRDSRLGPGVAVGADCKIDGASIEDSIVMDGALVQGGRLRNSIIGRNAVVHAGADHAFDGLLLGDECRVELL